LNWFPLLLTAHVILAVSLLAPSLVLPFLLRRQPAGGEPSTIVRLLATLQGTGSVVIGIGLAATPTANGRTSPIVCPIVTFPRCPGVHSRAIIATASFSRSMNGSPETSTMASLIVPPVNANGLVPG